MSVSINNKEYTLTTLSCAIAKGIITLEMLIGISPRSKSVKDGIKGIITPIEAGIKWYRSQLVKQSYYRKKGCNPNKTPKYGKTKKQYEEQLKAEPELQNRIKQEHPRVRTWNGIVNIFWNMMKETYKPSSRNETNNQSVYTKEQTTQSKEKKPYFSKSNFMNDLKNSDNPKKVYRKACMEWHPDHHNDSIWYKEYSKIFCDIQNVYERFISL